MLLFAPIEIAFSFLMARCRAAFQRSANDNQESLVIVIASGSREMAALIGPSPEQACHP